MSNENPQSNFVRLEIRQAANGFVVLEGTYYREPYDSYGSAHVFQSFAELTYFLAKKLTHRQEAIHGDRV